MDMRRSPTPTTTSRPGGFTLVVVVIAGILLWTLTAIGGTAAAKAGTTDVPYPAPGGRDVEIPAGERSFSALVTYPVTDAAWGDDPGVPLPGGPWPVVIFGHGYLAPVELYLPTLRSLATKGFITVAPRSAGELFPDHAAFAADLRAVIDWLEAENATPGSWLAGAVDLDAIAVSGHSMGGGASLLAAAADPRIRAVAPLAPAETRPSSIEAAASITVPTLLIAAELDAITPVPDHQVPMYQALTGAPSQLRTILGGSHCGFTAPENGGAIGALTGLVCDEGTIEPETQQALAEQLMADWLRYHLLDDASLADRAWPPVATGSDQPIDLGDGTTVMQRP
jgi:dienelactone hydrolase